MRGLSLVCCLCLTVLFSGCGLMKAAQQMGGSVKANSYDPYDSTDNEYDYINRAEEESMQSARMMSNMSPSNEVDKWWFDYLSSEKAKSIERSVGVNYD